MKYKSSFRYLAILGILLAGIGLCLGRAFSDNQTINVTAGEEASSPIKAEGKAGQPGQELSSSALMSPAVPVFPEAAETPS